MLKDDKKQYRCSFAEKTQEQVHRLISGPGDVCIYDECVGLCSEIVNEEMNSSSETVQDDKGINLMKPMEMKNSLTNTLSGQDETKKNNGCIGI